MKNRTLFSPAQASIWALLNVVCLVVLACSAAQAQTFQSTVVGQVTDAAGAAIAGAKVTITAQGTGRTATATTGSDGGFVIPQLPPGRYELQVEATGFRRTIKPS